MTWEERWHPLREEWVIVAAHRQVCGAERRTVHVAEEVNQGARPAGDQRAVDDATLLCGDEDGPADAPAQSGGGRADRQQA